jgi:hypothetical protein
VQPNKTRNPLSDSHRSKTVACHCLTITHRLLRLFFYLFECLNNKRFYCPPLCVAVDSIANLHTRSWSHIRLPTVVVARYGVQTLSTLVRVLVDFKQLIETTILLSACSGHLRKLRLSWETAVHVALRWFQTPLR